MNKKVIHKKLQHIKSLLTDLERLLGRPYEEFRSNIDTVRSAERSFELMVETADDINAHILTEKTGKTPDSYQQAFLALRNIDVISDDTATILGDSAKIRNILVHEYDFEADYEKFYHSVKACIPAYQEYLRRIHKFIR